MYKRQALDRAAKEIGINFIGGFSALVQKGYQKGDEILIDSIPRALAETDVYKRQVLLLLWFDLLCMVLAKYLHKIF